MTTQLPKTIRIADFMTNEWVQYADYDNRRKLPHIMDGLKITQRKVMYTATLLPKNDKPIRVSQFASEAAKVTAYHHGEASMLDTVVNLAQDYPGSNNYPYLEKHGQFGSRLSNESAAPRYIHTKLHQNWNKLFLKEDQEIVEYLYDDGDKIEPKYFIPIVPTILLNGVDGVGNGFKSFILPYELGSVAKACREYIKHGKVKTPLVPYINGWKGKIEKVDKQVILTGAMRFINTTKIEITELPPRFENESYKIHLNKLVEEGIIKDYHNKSTEDGWHWIIDCSREFTSKGEENAMKVFKLVERTTENFVCWGMDEKAPMTFDSPEALLAHWCDERLKLYDASIKHQIKVCQNEIRRADLKMRFIQWCLKNDFRKFSKAEFIQKSVAGIKGLTEDIASEFVGIAMYKITTDEVAKLEIEIDKSIEYLEELQALTPLILMEKNLKGL